MWFIASLKWSDFYCWIFPHLWEVFFWAFPFAPISQVSAHEHTLFNPCPGRNGALYPHDIMCSSVTMRRSSDWISLQLFYFNVFRVNFRLGFCIFYSQCSTNFSGGGCTFCQSMNTIVHWCSIPMSELLQNPDTISRHVIQFRWMSVTKQKTRRQSCINFCGRRLNGNYLFKAVAHIMSDILHLALVILCLDTHLLRVREMEGFLLRRSCKFMTVEANLDTSYSGFLQDINHSFIFIFSGIFHIPSLMEIIFLYHGAKVIFKCCDLKL